MQLNESLFSLRFPPLFCSLWIGDWNSELINLVVLLSPFYVWPFFSCSKSPPSSKPIIPLQEKTMWIFVWILRWKDQKRKKKPILSHHKLFLKCLSVSKAVDNTATDWENYCFEITGQDSPWAAIWINFQWVLGILAIILLTYSVTLLLSSRLDSSWACVRHLLLTFCYFLKYFYYFNCSSFSDSTNNIPRVKETISVQVFQ